MGILSGMTDKTSPRGFSWIWFIRIAQFIITLLVIALAALNANAWKDCSVPGKIAWNLACGTISFLVLIYFLLSTGPGKIFKLLPWLVWGQVILDAIMFIFWIAAAGTSKLNCKDYCKACSDSYGVDWNGLSCACGLGSVDLSDLFKRDTSPALQGLRGLLEPRRSRGGGHSSSDSSGSDKLGTVAARTAGNAIMTVLFFVTLVVTIWWIFSQRRSNGTAAATLPPPTQAEAGNAGFPMTSNPQPAPGYAPQMGEQYPQGQPQPQAQQPVYDPSHPQGQYPPQQAYQPGAPAQY